MSDDQTGLKPWAKGGPSPNPTGRPRGAAAIAREIMKKTNNGSLMVDTLIELAKTPGTSAAARRVRMDASRELLNRAIGKAITLIDVHGSGDTPASEIVAGMSTAKLERLVKLALEPDDGVGIIDVKGVEILDGE